MKKKSEHKNVNFNSQISFFEISEQFSEKQLFTFLKDKETPVTVTGKMLSSKVQAYGSILQQKVSPQGKVLLLFPQGLEYIYSLLACWYANAIAIPTPLTDINNKKKLIETIKQILTDSQASCLITDTVCLNVIDFKKEFPSLTIINVREISSEIESISPPRPYLMNDIGIILYTSGSTADPKGVMLTHENIFFQARKGCEQWNVEQESCFVSWAPQFHSMGILANILIPLLKGAGSVILSPDNFVNTPQIWLETISLFKATHTGAPNFAFDHCVSLIDPGTLSEVSLKTLEVIFCGGEPVRRETYDNFANTFKILGLNKNVFCPNYGLSESGPVTTKRPGTELQVLSIDISSLKNNRVNLTGKKNWKKDVVSCGVIAGDVEVLCVNPEAFTVCSSNEVGEVWIKSPAVGIGYWNNLKQSEDIFSAALGSTGEKGFFRTGDLGFIFENQLYIVGRRKEVIIRHGKNHYPIDIEWTIKKQFPGLNLPVVVFRVDSNEKEKIVVVQEIAGDFSDKKYKKVIIEMMSTVSDNHGLDVHEVLFVEKGSIPKTGSGKIIRNRCKGLFQKNELKVMYHFQKEMPGINDKQAFAGENYSEVFQRLKNDVFFPELSISPDFLDEINSINELGLNSIQIVRIAKRIEQVFKVDFSPVLLFKFNSISHLLDYLNVESKETFSPDKNEVSLNERSAIVTAPAIKEEKNIHDSDIAVIGIDCNFPGGSVNPGEFWCNLLEQKDCITPIAHSRPGILSESTNSFPRWGGFIEDVNKFDAAFFGVSPLEANCMDPQQRKFLELTWRVIEDSGYNPREMSGMKVGLFVGVHNNDYAEIAARNPSLVDVYGAHIDSGMHMSMIANRVSHWFNFKGPSEIINTACSSSLVALHNAVASINRGDCLLALAGGINLIFTSRVFRAGAKAGMLAEDGRCKTFDKEANGFVRSEGYGAVLLKPLYKALEDKDSIYGVIKGSQLNHGGQSQSLRAPNPNAQKDLIVSAYKEAHISCETVSYIEAHGTGTELGDPIEFQSLIEAFNELNPDCPSSYCGVGSVKTNIGHSESAAGIAGIIKVLLSMKNRILPGILHFKELNPYISLENTPFYILDKSRKWEPLKDKNNKEIPLRSGVSSFGVGGVNVHVVLEEHISSPAVSPSLLPGISKQKMLIPFSVRNAERMESYISRFLGFFNNKTADDYSLEKGMGNFNLMNIAYTLQVGRIGMEERIAFVVESLQDLIKKMDEFVKGKREIKGFWKGRMDESKAMVSLFSKDSDSLVMIEELIASWIKNDKLDKVAEWWVKGGDVNWSILYGKETPGRVNLPVYSFAKEEFWIDKMPGASFLNKQFESNTIGQTDSASGGAIPGYVHPFLHQNNSDFMEQRFSSSFTGEEFFWVNKSNINDCFVIETVFLEMIRKAVVYSLGKEEGEAVDIVLSDIQWKRHLTISDGRQINIRLFPDEQGDISYHIYRENDQDENKPLVYCQGWACICESSEPLVYDLKALAAQCYKEKSSVDLFYADLEESGYFYEPEQRALKELSICSDYAILRMLCVLPVRELKTTIGLPPFIMDVVLKSALWLMARERNTKINSCKVDYLFELKIIERFENLDFDIGAKIYTEKNSSIGGYPEKTNVELYDNTGKVRVKLTLLLSVNNEPQFPNAVIVKESGKKTVPDSLMISNNTFSMTDLKEELKNSLAKVLFTEKGLIDEETQFVDMGMDSIIGVEWIRMINSTFKINFPATRVYDYPNIQMLADFLIDKVNRN